MNITKSEIALLLRGPPSRDEATPHPGSQPRTGRTEPLRGELESGPRGASDGRHGGRLSCGDAQRHDRESRDADDDRGDGAGSDGAGRLTVEHGNSPSEGRERPRRTGRREARSRPRHAEAEQQASVFLRSRVHDREHVRVAGRFATERVLARREVHERMKEEHALRNRRHAPEPEVRPLDVRQLVTERHALLPLRQRVERAGGQEDQRLENAGDERCADVVRDTDARRAPEPETRREFGRHDLCRGWRRRRPCDEPGHPPPSACAGDRGGDNPQHPRDDQCGGPLAADGLAADGLAADGLAADGLAGDRSARRARGPGRFARAAGVRRSRGFFHDAELPGGRPRLLSRCGGGQNRDVNGRRPDEREDELGGDAPPQGRARRRGEPRHEPAECPDGSDENRALEGRPNKDLQHHRSFPLPAFSLATMSSSSRSSASETWPASER